MNNNNKQGSFSESNHNEAKNRYPYGDGHFEVNPKGVYYFGVDREGNSQKPRWICAPLHIIAKTRSERNDEWGRLLEWQDDDSQIHQWAMPIEQLEGDGAEVRRELARLGLQISPNQTERSLLSAYIKAARVDTRARCIERLGWYETVYVTPSCTFGKSEETIVFQNAHSMESNISQSGSSIEWTDSVAKLALRNSRLVFAISCGFAGCLTKLANEDSGGFHLRGASSSGKSTALTMAASVWGKPQRYIALWRSTVNGLEGLAALHNDNLLILDEIGQVDPNGVGDAAYLLANGQGKTRASKSGSAKPAQKWTTIFLSAGEESLSSIMAKAGKRTSAGQEIRLADIEADAGQDMGIFEELHGRPNASNLAKEIKDNSSKNFGSIGILWLENITNNRDEIADSIKALIANFVSEIVPPNAIGQVERVARRFGLVAIAGELATRFGLTGWPVGHAKQAAKLCFESWFENFGGNVRHEEQAIIAQTRAFFEAHGASRFEDMKATDDQRIYNRVGFFRTNAELKIREYIILPEAFISEICQGRDEKYVKKALIQANILIPSTNGNPSQNFRLPSLGSVKAYLFRY